MRDARRSLAPHAERRGDLRNSDQGREIWTAELSVQVLDPLSMEVDNVAVCAGREEGRGHLDGRLLCRLGFYAEARRRALAKTDGRRMRLERLEQRLSVGLTELRADGRLDVDAPFTRAISPVLRVATARLGLVAATRRAGCAGTARRTESPTRSRSAATSREGRGKDGPSQSARPRGLAQPSHCFHATRNRTGEIWSVPWLLRWRLLTVFGRMPVENVYRHLFLVL